jgi:hypothetical protein
MAQFDVLCVSLREMTEIDHENSEAFFTAIIYTYIYIQFCFTCIIV